MNPFFVIMSLLRLMLAGSAVELAVPHGEGGDVIAEAAGQHLDQGHGAVLAAGAADGEGVVGAPLLLHQRQGPAQSALDPLQELAEVVGLQQVFLHGPVAAREGLEGFHVEGVG